MKKKVTRTATETSPKKIGTRAKKITSSKNTKSKSVNAEIVEEKDIKFKDINSSISENDNSELSTSDSPLDIAAVEAEKAYNQVSDDDEIEDSPIENIELGPSKNKSLAVSDSKLPTVNDPLMVYLNEIRKYPLLSREKEKEVAIKYFETKDPEAAQLLVRSNLRFVVKIAAEYSKFGAKLIDLIQEGNVGLMHAVREFNPHKGAKLITYAVWWIRGYIQEYLMKQYSMVRIGTTSNQRKLFYSLQKEKNNLDNLASGKNLDELSERLGIPKDEILSMAQRISGRDVSLDRPIDDEGSPSLGAFQSSSLETPEESLAREEMISLLREKVTALEPDLSEREKIILHERLMNDEPLTLQEIGTKYGITREAVRQMEARLIKKIKDKLAIE